MEYFYNKPKNGKQNTQLFSEDINISGSKKYFFASHESVFHIISNNPNSKQLCLYEEHSLSKLIKLHFDIDIVQKYEHNVIKKQEARVLCNNLIPKIISKIKKSVQINFEPKYNIWISDGFHKLSLHIIFINIYFENIYVMKDFALEFEGIDQSIYRRCSFRLPGCVKFGKLNVLKFLLSNYPRPGPLDLFLDSCVTYESIIEQKFIFKSNLINPVYQIKTICNNDDFIYDVNLIPSIQYALDKINLSDYNIWFAITIAIKDLYIHVRESQDQIYHIYDNACAKYPGYNSIVNRKTFDMSIPYYDINYLFYLAEINPVFLPYYDLNKITFNHELYPAENLIIQYNDYIKIDYSNLSNYSNIFIKSPTSTGKTRALKNIIQTLKCDNIIAITSRINLAGEIMGDLGLAFYKTMERKDFTKCDKLAIQLESLHKSNIELFEDGIIILDEINSFLSHFRSVTLDETRRLNFLCLVELIKQARYVICLDADMCDWNIKFINILRPNNKYIIYYNRIANKVGIPAIFYSNEYVMIEKMKQDIQANKYFVSCFDSLTYMKKVIGYLSIWADKSKILVYSSEQEYNLVNTKEWLGKWVFYSPTIIYGVSYDLSLSDVYSFTKKDHLNSCQIYQMINRTRLINQVHVYCNDNTYFPKYKSINDVTHTFKLLESNLLKYIDLQTDLYIDEEKTCYSLMLNSHTFIDHIIKSNKKYYLQTIMAKLGFDIKFNTEYNCKIEMENGKYTKSNLKQAILDIFKIKDISLNPFQTKLFSSDNLIEKHFNLRSYYKESEQDKISTKIYKSLFSESLKNRYLKIKLCREFMKELGYNSIEEIQFIKREKTLCETCTTSILKPKKENSKKKSYWCNKLLGKLSPNDTISTQIYANIICGKTCLCRTCKNILINKVTITNEILYKPPKLEKFVQKVKSQWINDNLNIILEIFGLKNNEYEEMYYYNFYLLMITMLKHVFGTDLFQSERIKLTNCEIHIYSINQDELLEHKYLIDLLDSQKLNVKQYDFSLLNFFEDNSGSEDSE
jgi:hypothetical protein